jgi:hypothetical protein
VKTILINDINEVWPGWSGVQETLRSLQQELFGFYTFLIANQERNRVIEK